MVCGKFKMSHRPFVPPMRCPQSRMALRPTLSLLVGGVPPPRISTIGLAVGGVPSPRILILQWTRAVRAPRPQVEAPPATIESADWQDSDIPEAGRSERRQRARARSGSPSKFTRLWRRRRRPGLAADHVGQVFDLPMSGSKTRPTTPITTAP